MQRDVSTTIATLTVDVGVMMDTIVPHVTRNAQKTAIKEFARSRDFVRTVHLGLSVTKTVRTMNVLFSLAFVLVVVGKAIMERSVT